VHSIAFRAETKQQQVKSLISEIHSLIRKENEGTYESEKIEFSDELSQFYRESKTIENAWREYYNYSLVDDRFLNATQPIIYEDYLIIKLREFREAFEENIGKAPTDRTEEEIRAEAVAELEAMKNNRANYASEEEIEKYSSERDRLEKMFTDDMEHMTREDGFRLREFREIEKTKQLAIQLQKDKKCLANQKE
jgi:hypothetical protein